MPKERTKNQHYVPQSLLRHFADTEEKLFEAYLPEKKVFPTNVADTMSETYTYEYDKLPVNTIEKAFSKIEGEVATGVEEIIDAIESVKKNGDDIDKVKGLVKKNLNRFLLFYYRSGALLTEYSFGNDDFKIPLLLNKILNYDYIDLLAESVIGFYDFAVIESCDDFLISDQYISTAALKIKTHKFIEKSNRHIGLKDTIILIPISSSFYIVFWNSLKNLFLEKDLVNKLNATELNQVNTAIINNSYIKSVTKKKKSLEDVLDNFNRKSPTQIFAGGNPDGYVMGTTKKKEVFFSEEEKEAYELLEFSTYTQYEELGRNDDCACDSGDKFKNCHEDAYKRAQSVMLTFGRPAKQNAKDFFISGIPIIEKPIHKWSGFSNSKTSDDN